MTGLEDVSEHRGSMGRGQHLIYVQCGIAKTVAFEAGEMPFPGRFYLCISA